MSGTGRRTEFGRCLNHGYVTERCCVLFEPTVRQKFVRSAVARVARGQHGPFLRDVAAHLDRLERESDE